MNAEKLDPTRQARLEDVLADYLARLDRGEPVDQTAWLRAHADLADDLQSYLDAAREVDSLARRAFEPTGLRPVDAPHELIHYFGDYQILNEVARGGMGVVYRARQVSLNRVVAVKTILAGRLAGEDDVRRFISEAEAAASLRHANIAAIFEIGEHDGHRYYSMEFVEGTSLAELVRESPLPTERAARYVRLIAGAIAYAHERGILHRDLKPSNILIDRDDQPRVTDFGLAKRVAAEQGMTATGQVLGTPSYMPPEQASADRGKISATSDVYSLGAILYELLCGRPPFQASSPMETIVQVLQTPPVSPRLVNPSVPRDLETITLKCLEKEPARRYESAQALADDLDRWLEGKPILARPAGPLERLAKWARRRPVIVVLLALVALASATSLVGLAAFAYQYTQTAGERQRVVRALRKSEENLYVSQIALAQNAWQRNDLEQARATLDSAPREPRHWEWHYLHRIAQPPPSLRLYRSIAFRPHHENEMAGVILTRKDWRSNDGTSSGWSDVEELALVDRRSGVPRLTLPGYVARPIGMQFENRQVAFSPDGRTLLTARSYNNDSKRRPASIQLWNADTGAFIFELPRAETPGEVHALAFHPDGTRFASSHHEWGLPNGAPTVRIWDATSGKRLHTLGSTWTTVIQFHPKHPWLAADARLWNIATGALVRDLNAPAERACTFRAWSPDGALMAVLPHNAPTLIELRETDTGHLRSVLSGHTQRLGRASLAFSPDGAWLASGTFENNRKGEIKLWDVSRGAELRSYRGARGGVDRLVFHPSAPELAVAARDETLLLDPRRDQDCIPLPLPDQREFEDGFLWFTPDSRRLVTSNADGSTNRPQNLFEPMKLTVRDAQSGTPLWQTHTEKGPVAFAPDGTLLAFIANDGVRLLDAATGRVVRVLPEVKAFRTEPSFNLSPASPRSAMLAFDPTGKFLACRAPTPEKTVRIVVWDAQTGRELSPPPGWGINVEARPYYNPSVWLPAGPHRGAVWGAHAVVSDTTLSARADGRAIIVRDQVRKTERRLGPFAHDVESLAFNLNGSQIVGQAGTEIRAWDVATGRALPVPPGIAPYTGLAFGAMGERLVMSGEVEDVAIRRADGTSLTMFFRFRYGHGREFDPRLRWAVMFEGGSDRMSVLDIPKGRQSLVAGITTRLISCATFPDGERVVTGDEEGEVRVWDTSTWTTVLTIQAHARGVRSVAVSPDGRRIATAGWDGVLKLWDGTP